MLPHFITFANGPHDEDLVRAGNESVIRARYEDAAFFWRADLEVSPEEFRSRLRALTFEERLGSFDDRVKRIADLAQRFTAAYDLDEKDAETVRRAASLGKFDLASQMVVELSSLAGTMAQEYAVACRRERGRRPGAGRDGDAALLDVRRAAQRAGRRPLPGRPLRPADEPVCRRVRPDRHLRPLRRPAYCPRTGPGVAGVPDAVGGLGARRDPSRRRAPGRAGHRDECRRAGAGRRLRPAALRAAARSRPGTPMRSLRAVLPAADRPARADELVTVLSDALEDEHARSIVAALQRSMRILPGGLAEAAVASLSDTAEPAERELEAVVMAIEDAMAGHEGDVARLFSVGGALPAAAERFFEEIRVMHDDAEVALAAVARVAALGGREVDWLAL